MVICPSVIQLQDKKIVCSVKQERTKYFQFLWTNIIEALSKTTKGAKIWIRTLNLQL